MTSLRETYARDICQNPGVPLEDCPRRDEHYALVDERLGGFTERLAEAMSEAWPADTVFVDDSAVWRSFAPLVVEALEDRT